MSDSPLLPWDDSEDPHWIATVTSWGWRRVEDHDPTVVTFRIQGTCPRCGAGIFQDEPIGFGYGGRGGYSSGGRLRGEEELLNTLQEQLPETVKVHCNCNEKHDATKTGCGRQGH